MDYLWVLLMVIAQLSWAIEIYIDKHLLRHQENKTETVEDENSNSVGKLVLVSAFFSVVVAAIIFIVMVSLHGADKAVTMIALEREDILTAICVGVMEIGWLIAYFYALHYADETTAPPVFQTIPIFGFVFGFLFFNELPTQIQVIAALIIIFGSVLLNLEMIKKRAEEGANVKLNKKALVLMLVASLVIALTAFLFKDAAQSENYWGTSFWMCIGAFLTGVMAWIIVPSYRYQFNSLFKKHNREIIAINVINEILDNVARLAFFGAVVLGPSTSIVQSMNAFQPVWLLLIGVILAKNGSKNHADKLSEAELIKRGLSIMIIVMGSLLLFI